MELNTGAKPWEGLQMESQTIPLSVLVPYQELAQQLIYHRDEALWSLLSSHKEAVFLRTKPIISNDGNLIPNITGRFIDPTLEVYDTEESCIDTSLLYLRSEFVQKYKKDEPFMFFHIAEGVEEEAFSSLVSWAKKTTTDSPLKERLLSLNNYERKTNARIVELEAKMEAISGENEQLKTALIKNSGELPPLTCPECSSLKTKMNELENMASRNRWKPSLEAVCMTLQQASLDDRKVFKDDFHGMLSNNYGGPSSILDEAERIAWRHFPGHRKAGKGEKKG
jgi:hypothetical protein